MLKLRHKFYIFIFLVIAAAGFSASLYHKALLPIRSGHIRLKSISDKVKVDFDKFGVAHIQAANQLDALRALGYLQAQDRLFQTEMLRRIGYGELSEIAGPSTIKIDKLFKSLNLAKFAKARVEALKLTNPEVLEKAQAFIDGINEYQKLGPKPLEFSLMGIPSRDFSLEDIYVILGYISFSFDKAFKTDILLSNLKNSLDEDYIKDISLANSSELSARNELPIELKRLFADIDETLEDYPRWNGSNAWLIAKEKSSSAMPIFANDTHIATSAPTVWWEARVSYPGYDTHGYYMGGIPFPIIGDTRTNSWGVTIFHKDSTDFIKEELADKNNIVRGDKLYKITSEDVSFKIKGEKDYKFKRYESDLGPILKDSFSEKNKNYLLTVSWDYLKDDNEVLKGLYIVSHARDKEEFTIGASQIIAPSLNLFYTGVEGDIIHITTGRLKDYEGQNPNFVLNPPKDKTFKRLAYASNPNETNPEFGIIYNANQQPSKGVDGYYAYPSRYRLIGEFFHEKNSYSVEDSKKLQLSDDITYDRIVLDELLPLLSSQKEKLKAYQLEALEVLSKWDGKSPLDSIGASIFYELLSFIGINAFNDELGAHDIDKFQETAAYLGTLINIIKNPNSPWWDNSHTGYQETRDDIVFESFIAATENLRLYYGRKTKNWQWKQMHVYEATHPVGKVKPFDLLFNFKSVGVAGGLESPNGFKFLLKPGQKTVKGGAAVRRIRDFKNPNTFLSIIPGGQSGNVFDKHYNDQYEMFLKGEYRTVKFHSNTKPVSTLEFTK